MADAENKPPPPESADARQAWADYLAMGADRSLDKLAAQYRNGTTAALTRRRRTLATWSVDYGWQDRLRAIADEQAAEAAEVRRSIYLRTIREYDRRTGEAMIQAMHLDSIHGVHDRMKPDAPNGDGISLTVPFTIVITEREDGPQ